MIKGNVWNGACTEFYKRRADKFLGDYGVTCNWHSYKLFPLQKYILSHWLQVQHVWDKITCFTHKYTNKYDHTFNAHCCTFYQAFH